MITNFEEIFNRLRNMGRIFTGNSDIEILATLVETLSKYTDNMVDTLKMILKYVKGAYSIILLENDGNLYALRDQNGYKPLCHGKLKMNEKKYHIISSESCAIDALGGTLTGDINPGEIVKINPVEGLKRFKMENPRKNGLCQFEYIYYARPDSVLNGISIAEVRYRLGRNLARNDYIPSDNVIVVPVPDSGRSCAMGYAWESGILYQEGLMKNRYIWQIQHDPLERLNPIKKIIEGKDIVLIDDSIISGDTIKKIISMLRKVGARSIHVRISCPPIINYCNLNNNFLSREVLIGRQTKVNNDINFRETITKSIGADSLRFQTIRGLIEAIGLPPNQICYTCLREQLIENEEKKFEHPQIFV